MSKRLGIMLFPEILDSLESLSNEEIGQMFRLIIKWNKGDEVIPEGSLEKFVWATLLPKLESNKEKYEGVIERNQINGKKGGRPKKNNKTQNNPVGYSGNPENPNYNYNYNSINNSSKEELLNKADIESSGDDSIVSKGLEALESIFPQGRNYVGMDEVLLWNSLSQGEKQSAIGRARLYIRNEMKKEDGKYIKKLSKWLSEQVKKGLETKMPSIKNSTSSDDPRLLKFTDGGIYTFILNQVKTTQQADRIYSEHNKKELYSTKDEMLKGIFDSLNKKD